MYIFYYLTISSIEKHNFSHNRSEDILKLIIVWHQFTVVLLCARNCIYLTRGI
jgi:hypothetical protein